MLLRDAVAEAGIVPRIMSRALIATLHERMGHSDRAEPVYRSVLLEDRSNVDAMLGVGSMLIKKGKATEAIVRRDDAEMERFTVSLQQQF